MYTQCQHCGELTPQRVPMIIGNPKPQPIPAGTIVSLPDGGEVMLMHATLVEAVETDGVGAHD